MRVLVAGSTTWKDEAAVRRELETLPADSIVIYGDAPGADAIGGAVASSIGLTVEPFVKNEDDYRRYRRGAWKGLNERMLASGIDLILAFHADVDSSTGTKHLVKLAKLQSVEVRVIVE